jgi:hypothetical protein
VIADRDGAVAPRIVELIAAIGGVDELDAKRAAASANIRV